MELAQTDVLSVEQDPFKKWKRGRQGTLEARKWLHYGLIAIFLAMIWYAGRRLDDWELTALSTILITGVFELTCYYYSYLVLMALLSMRRMSYMIAMVGLVVSGHIIHLAEGWYDTQYVWESVAVLIAQMFVLIGLCIETYLADRNRRLAPPITAGLLAVSPAVCVSDQDEKTVSEPPETISEDEGVVPQPAT